MSSEAGNSKTSGTISANDTGNSTPSMPAASTSGSLAPTRKKKVDIHKLFQRGGTPALAEPSLPTRTNSGHADTASPPVRPHLPGYDPPEMYLQQPGYCHHAHAPHRQGQQKPRMSPGPGTPPLNPAQSPQTPISATVSVPKSSRTFTSSAPAFVPRRSAVVINAPDGREVNFHPQKTESPEPASAQAVPPRDVRRQSAQIRLEDPEKKRAEKAKKAKAKAKKEEERAKADLETRDIVERKVRSLLNKLTTERFASISEQIVEVANQFSEGQNSRMLMQVIKLIIEEATVDVPRSEMYACLCRKMMENVNPDVRDDSVRDSQGNHIRGAQLFRKYLFNQCQENFERAWAAKGDTQATVIGNSLHNATLVTSAEKSREAPDPANVKLKRRGFDLMKFFRELFKQSLLTERIMHECIKKFLVNADDPNEEEIESLCHLLSVLGQTLDTPRARGHMNAYFGRMQTIADSKHIPPRLRFMLLDVIELRDRGWVPRNKVAAPMELAQNDQGR